jgi:glycolate oxidase iron-sulfur subunit
MMKEYAHLLHDDPPWRDRATAVAAKVRDVSELLAAAGPATGAPVMRTVTYDAPCHLLHAQRIVRPPLAVLAAVPGLTVVPLTDADQCCGAAGIYNLTHPEMSRAVLARKMDALAEADPDWIATGNPGCLMQIRAGAAERGLRAQVVHPVELLERAFEGDAFRASTM